MHKKVGRSRKSRTEEKSEARSGFAPNMETLAEILGVTRQTLHNTRKRFGATAPKSRADRRYPIAEYARWLDRVAVKGRRKDSELAGEREIRFELTKLELERKRFEFERIRDQMLPVAQFEAALAKTMSAFLAALKAFGPRVNESLEGLHFNDRARVIETEVELLRK